MLACWLFITISEKRIWGIRKIGTRATALSGVDTQAEINNPRAEPASEAAQRVRKWPIKFPVSGTNMLTITVKIKHCTKANIDKIKNLANT